MPATLLFAPAAPMPPPAATGPPGIVEERRVWGWGEGKAKASGVGAGKWDEQTTGGKIGEGRALYTREGA